MGSAVPNHVQEMYNPRDALLLMFSWTDMVSHSFVHSSHIFFYRSLLRPLSIYCIFSTSDRYLNFMHENVHILSLCIVHWFRQHIPCINQPIQNSSVKQFSNFKRKEFQKCARFSRILLKMFCLELKNLSSFSMP